MTNKHDDSSYAMSGGWGAAIFHNGPECLEGYVTTTNGIVRVFSVDKTDRMDAQTVATMTHAGRCYRRTWRRSFTKRGLTIMAGKFARDVVGGWC